VCAIAGVTGPKRGETPPGLRLIVVARLEDAKLRSKLAPLVALEGVDELILVRRRPLALEGVSNRCPPAWAAGLTPLAEAWRVWTLFRLCARRPRPSFLIALYMVPHGLYVELARRLFGLRVIQVTLSQLDVELALRSKTLRRALFAAHRVGVRGENSRRRLVAAGLSSARVFDPPNVYDPGAYAPGAPAEPDFDLVYVGGLVKCKRLDLLLQAAARVRRGRPDLRLALVGDGDRRRDLERLADTLGLGACVTFAGERPTEEVASWLRRARLFILTSEVEGLPMAMIEALSCGLPVIVPDVGDITTVARDGENAWIVTAATPEAYAEAIETLLADPARRQRLAEGALATRERFARDYSLESGIMAWRAALADQTFTTEQRPS
jgi:glycosyltransferase involved in cell wall biosynthesis